MATEKAQTNTTTPNTTPPAANGTTPPADKPQRPPREVPTIVCSPDKAEYAEVKEAVTALMGGLNMNVAFGPFVLAAALAHIRGNAKIQAAVKSAREASK